MTASICIFDDTARFEFVDSRSKAFHRFPILISEPVTARFSRVLCVSRPVFRICSSRTAPLYPYSLPENRKLRAPSFDEFPFVRCGDIVETYSRAMLGSLLSPQATIVGIYDNRVATLSSRLALLDSHLLFKPGVAPASLNRFY